MPRRKLPANSRSRKGAARPQPGGSSLPRRLFILAGASAVAAGVLARLFERSTARIPAQGPEGGGIGELIASLPPDDAKDPLRASPPMEEEPLPHDTFVPAGNADVASVPLPAAPDATAPVPVRPPMTGVKASPAAAPRWLDNARPLAQAGGRPVIAVVIDDLGLDVSVTRRVVDLDGNVTLAFMTYADQLPQWLGRARAGRHEYLVHVPMQPISASVDPGPNALTVGLDDAEILARLRWGLDRMEGYVGANNHMGSRFTEDRAGMRTVLAEVKSRGLLFLDSRTTADSVCAPIAASLRLPFAQRNVFLDDVPTEAGVAAQLATLEAVARRHGTAIGIGHPHPATATVLAQWLPAVEARGISVLPLTSVMRYASQRA